MRIKKALNNNVAIATNDQGEDAVVLGKGIAFGKKVGDEIDATRVNGVYVQHTEETARIVELLRDLPEEYIDAATRIVESAKVRLGRDFEGNLFFALADHLHYTIERARQGMLIKNRLLLETKLIYRDEYGAAASALSYINKRFDVKLPEDEAAFIALHFVNATLGSTMEDSYRITSIVHEIYSIIRNWFTITLDEESLSWYRLMVHIKFFAQRMVLKQGDATNDPWLLSLVKEQYPASLECAEAIAGYLKQYYQFDVPDSEKAYLAIHIEHVNHGLCKEEQGDDSKEGTGGHGDVR